MTSPGISIGNSDLELIYRALETLPAESVAIAQAFRKDRASLLVNYGYCRGDWDPVWRCVSGADFVRNSQDPVVVPAYQSAPGALVMTQDVADRIGALDTRFATRLADLDWLRRAEKLNIPCYVVRNARAQSEACNNIQDLGDRYSVVRDSLLFERKHNAIWLLQYWRLGVWLVDKIWRPLDLSPRVRFGTDYLKRLLWVWSSDFRGLRNRMNSYESKATLAAMRDVLFNRYTRRGG